MVATPAATAHAADCATPTLITAAGSGEYGAVSGVGPEMAYVASQVRHDAANSGSGLNVVAIDYPAVAALFVHPNLSSTWRTLEGSEVKGVAAMRAAIVRAHQGCSGRPILLAGYSQGADVVTRTVNALSVSEQSSVSVGMLGSPNFLPYKTGDLGTYNHGRRGIRQSFHQTTFRLSENVLHRSVDVCLNGDSVCNFDITNAVTLAPPGHNAHYRYVESGFAVTAGHRLWALRTHPPTTPSGGATTPPPSGNPFPGTGGNVTLAQGPAAPAGYRYAIGLSGFPAGTGVSVTCYDSVSPGGFYTFTLTTDGSGSASTASYCYSGDGPDHWLHAGGIESNHVTWGGSSPPPPPPPPPPATYQETVGGVAHTWTDYSSAGGSQGPSIAPSQTVAIACKVTGFRVSDGDTWWYRIAQSPWNSAYYVSADAFYNNGATSGPLSGTPFVDGNVPNC